MALSSSTYIDTSALAKRYLREAGSDEFDRFLGRMVSVSISRLTMVELRCLLGRRRRNRDIDAGAERRAVAAFEDDVAQGFLEVHPLEDRHAIGASALLARLNAVPLRTLDALHLAIATAIGADATATADDTFAAAAAALRLRVEWFGRAEWSGRR
ncbi:MAG: type II toxin-antitoxin system VapC family toxin [Candidatus Binataceae bacterium]